MYLSTLLALQGWVINFLYNKIIIIIKRKYICIHTCNVVGRRKGKAKNLVKEDEKPARGPFVNTKDPWFYKDTLVKEAEEQ